MDRVAIFVDAGYLFAQGSFSLTGVKQPRASLSLDVATVIAELKTIAAGISPQLLRIYWYDGTIQNNRKSTEHTLLAISHDVKLRLGIVNSQGEQKGVDSLIVTDVIELARNHAMADAILLAGDEDVRIGVQIAQSYGVRVHLLGIAPSRASQSPLLMQEADTTLEWSAETVGRFLTIQTSPTSLVNFPLPLSTDAVTLVDIVTRVMQELMPEERREALSHCHSSRGVPIEIDKKLLYRAKMVLGRMLTTEERFSLRDTFRTALMSPPPTP